MSDGNRGKRTETITATLFGAAALFGAVILLYVLGVLNGREAERRYQSPHSHQERAEASAQSACAGFTEPDAMFKCVYEKVDAAEETAQTEQDLSAQQRAATAALSSAVVALVTLAVSIIGVWYVKRTLDATLEAVKDTGRATDAMERQNDIARQAQRPWLHFEINEIRQHAFVIINTDDERVLNVMTNATVTIRNSGGSPALEVDRRSYVQRGKGFTKKMQTEFFADKRQWYTVGNIPPGGTSTVELYEGCEIPIPPDTVPHSIHTVISISLGYRSPGSAVRHRTGQTFHVCKHVHPGGALAMLSFDELSAAPAELGQPLGVVCALATYPEGIMT